MAPSSEVRHPQWSFGGRDLRFGDFSLKILLINYATLKRRGAAEEDDASHFDTFPAGRIGLAVWILAREGSLRFQAVLSGRLATVFSRFSPCGNLLKETLQEPQASGLESRGVRVWSISIGRFMLKLTERGLGFRV